ncbi:MAG TPA: cytochrome P450, partial [Nannocystis sp.]
MKAAKIRTDTIPVDPGVDSTLALLREGYLFISNHCRRLESDAFRTRLFGRSVVCMSGREAAELFYDESRFQRSGAVPGRVLKTLLGRGGVQTLDGPAHRHRKTMFMALMGRERLDDLATLARACWRMYAARWMTRERVTLFSEALELHCRIASGWAGVPVSEAERPLLARDLWALVEAAGEPLGPHYWRGRTARRRTERWARGLVRQVRVGKIEAPIDCALGTVAYHRGLDGRLLDEAVAAVELINVLRPMVAVAGYAVFAALAMIDHPECRRRIREEGEAYLSLFVDEVRRYYPFAPFVA